MTAEMVLIAVLVAAGGWAYVHWSGRAFDRRYPHPVEPETSKKRQSAGR